MLRLLVRRVEPSSSRPLIRGFMQWSPLASVDLLAVNSRYVRAPESRCAVHCSIAAGNINIERPQAPFHAPARSSPVPKPAYSLVQSTGLGPPSPSTPSVCMAAVTPRLRSQCRQHRPDLVATATLSSSGESTTPTPR